MDLHDSHSILLTAVQGCATSDLFGTSAPWLAMTDAHIFEGAQSGSQFFCQHFIMYLWIH